MFTLGPHPRLVPMGRRIKMKQMWIVVESVELVTIGRDAELTLIVKIKIVSIIFAKKTHMTLAFLLKPITDVPMRPPMRQAVLLKRSSTL